MILCLPACLSRCLSGSSTCLSARLSLYQPACLSTCHATYLAAGLPLYLSTCLPLCLSVCLSATLPACLPGTLSDCLPTSFSAYHPIGLYATLSLYLSASLPVSLPATGHFGLLFYLSLCPSGYRGSDIFQNSIRVHQHVCLSVSLSVSMEEKRAECRYCFDVFSRLAVPSTGRPG